MAGFGGFRPAAFQFLRDLARNNRADWFEANRDVYEREVREPMRRLVETRDARLVDLVLVSPGLVELSCAVRGPTPRRPGRSETDGPPGWSARR